MTFQNSSEPKANGDDLLSDSWCKEPMNCEKHGAQEEKIHRDFIGRDMRFGCPICRRENEEERAREKERQAKFYRANTVRDLINSSGIPARHRGKQFVGFDARSDAQQNVLKIAQLYAEAIASGKGKPGASLLLVGPPGGGKTHIAVAIGEEVAAAGLKSFRYASCSELTRRVRATFSPGAEETETFIHTQMTRCGLLILDELAATSLSDHERKVLFEIIDTRYRELLPTVFVSNVPLAELSSIVGERIVDRLHEMATTLAFGWASHRSKPQHRAA